MNKREKNKERLGTRCSPNSQKLNGQDQVVTVGEPLLHVTTLFVVLSLSSSSPALDVLPAHTETFRMYTRKRDESTHGTFSVPHHTQHTTHTPHNNTQQRTTTTQQHSRREAEKM